MIVIPRSTGIIWRSRRTTKLRRLTRSAGRPAVHGRPPRGSSVAVHRQVEQREVVGPERTGVEAVNPRPVCVAIRAVVEYDEGGLLVDDLLDLVVHLRTLPRVELGAGSVDELRRPRVAPVAVERARAAV